MAKIIKNAKYVAKAGDDKQVGKYLFDAGDGSAPVDMTVWLEKSKANEKHPEGKPWIRCPKMTEVCNRGYFSEDLFIESDKGQGVVVEVKTAAARVLGASGVRAQDTKYLNEEDTKEFTTLVDGAVAKYKAAKGDGKKIKPEDMNKEQLEEYIAALKEGRKVNATTGPKSFIDMFTEVEYNRYQELLALNVENKANAPKAERKPLTDAEKAARKTKRDAKELSNAEKLLAAMMGGTPVAPKAAPAPVADDSDEDEDFDDEDDME